MLQALRGVLRFLKISHTVLTGVYCLAHLFADPHHYDESRVVRKRHALGIPMFLGSSIQLRARAASTV
jgi:hypothetical protein